MRLRLGNNQSFNFILNNQKYIVNIPKYINKAPKTINADGTIYNEVGYKEGYRLSSSGAEKAQDKAVTFGFIPCTRDDVIRLAGIEWMPTVADGYCYIAFYDINFNILSTLNCFRYDTNLVSNIGGSDRVNVLNKDKTSHSVTIDENGVVLFNLSYLDGKDFAYIRISAQGEGKNAIITLNEEIVYDKPSNILNMALMGDDQVIGWNSKGYTQNARLSSSDEGKVVTNYTGVAGMSASGYIPAKNNDVIRIKNFYGPNGRRSYIMAYDNSKKLIAYKQFGTTEEKVHYEWGGPNYGKSDWYTVEGIKKPAGVTTITLSSDIFGSNIAYIRFCGIITEKTIVTVNKKFI